MVSQTHVVGVVTGVAEAQPGAEPRLGEDRAQAPA